MKNLSLSRQILVVAALAVALMVAALSSVVTYLARQIAIAQTEKSLNEQTALIVTTLEFAQESLKTRATEDLRAFTRSLEGKIRASGRTIATGKENLPELVLGNTPLNGNHSLLEAYRQANPGQEPSFLVRQGDRFYRGATLLKNANGEFRHGEALSDKEEYVSFLQRGESYAGTIQRSGKMFAIAAAPIKDETGKVIGGMTLRLNAEDNITLLRNKLLSLKVGKTGYPYIISLPYGDQKEGIYIVHPTLSGKKASEAGPLATQVTERLIQTRNGVLQYQWADKDGQMRDKIVVVRELPELHWIAAVGSWTDEFTADTLTLRNQVIGISLLLGLALIAAIAYLAHHRLQPVAGVVDAAHHLGNGDLSVALDGTADSRNEVDILSHSLGQAIASMRGLIGNLQHTGQALNDTATDISSASGELNQATARQSEAAASMSAAAEELSVSIQRVADNAQAALTETNAAREVADASRQTVGQAISAMDQTASAVRHSAEQVGELGRRSQEIEAALAAIQGIAEQTNLLALNAAIEAARAGEQGRGFAVVADEVRKLAEQSSHTAQEISSILSLVGAGVRTVQDTIGQAVARAEDSVHASRQLEEALTQVSQRSAQVGTAIEDIAGATQEQSAAAQSIAQEIEQVASLTEATGQAAQANLERAARLVRAADNMQQDMQRFTL